MTTGLLGLPLSSRNYFKFWQEKYIAPYSLRPTFQVAWFRSFHTTTFYGIISVYIWILIFKYQFLFPDHDSISRCLFIKISKWINQSKGRRLCWWTEELASITVLTEMCKLIICIGLLLKVQTGFTNHRRLHISHV